MPLWLSIHHFSIVKRRFHERLSTFQEIGMLVVALRMLFGDATKCLGLVFGVALSTLLLCQQV